MIIEIIIALIVGVIVGTFTGLLPGLHINLVSAFLISISAFLLSLTFPITLVVFIVSLSITHTIIDFIPSIFLGAPEEETALSVLPGHELLLQGQGYLAIILCVFGAFTGLIILLIFTPIFIYLLPKIYPYVRNIIWIILILSSLYLIFTEKNKFLALIIFLLSGFLGIASLNLNLKEPLLPLFSGLFGASGLIISINQKTKIPSQNIIPIKHISFPKISFLKSSFSSIIASPIPAFLPAMGSSQASLIGSQIFDDLNQKEFLFLNSSINIIVLGLSFIALYSINKIRTGAAVAISQLTAKLSFSDLLIILTTIIISGILASLIAIKLAKFFAKNINKINYQKLSLFILIFLSISIITLSGFFGFLVFIISASLGISCILLNIKRTQLMGCLMIPTILFYLL